jgi:hypothetical protein
MTIAYNWSINNTDRLTADGFITTAYWNCNARDGEYFSHSYGSCGFASATPVIPYASVTEQDVLDWCWANGVDKDAVEASLAAQIDLQKAPVTATGVPW